MIAANTQRLTTLYAIVVDTFESCEDCGSDETLKDCRVVPIIFDHFEKRSPMEQHDSPPYAKDFQVAIDVEGGRHLQERVFSRIEDAATVACDIAASYASEAANEHARIRAIFERLRSLLPSEATTTA